MAAVSIPFDDHSGCSFCSMVTFSTRSKLVLQLDGYLNSSLINSPDYARLKLVTWFGFSISVVRYRQVARVLRMRVRPVFGLSGSRP